MYIATYAMFHIECTANTLLNTHLYALFTSQVLHIKPKKEQLVKHFEPIFQLLALIPYNKSMQQLDCYQAWCHLTQKVYYPLTETGFYFHAYIICTIVTKSGIIKYLQLSILMSIKKIIYEKTQAYNVKYSETRLYIE